jgi:hypothetical protein
MEFTELFSSLDPGFIALDGAKVLAINEISNWIKNYLDKEDWDDAIVQRFPIFGRFYYFIPFLVSAFLCVTMEQGFWNIVKCTILYGSYATATWNFHKKVIKGE